MEPHEPAGVEPTAPLPQPTAHRPARERSSLRRRAVLAAAGVAGLTALTRLARAGDLKPPPGPVVPTSPSLSAVQQSLGSSLDSKFSTLDTKIAFTTKGISEPRTPITSLPSSADAQFVITECGAYYLPGNIFQIPGKVAIDIQADHVDLDGQGFVFVGKGGGGGGGGGCLRASGRQVLEIYDCAFKDWQGACCDFDHCNDVHLSDVVFEGCVADSSTGVQGALVRCGDGACIEDVVFSSCVGTAVELQATGLFSDSHVLDHRGGAVRCADGACIEESRFLRIEGDAVVTGNNTTVTECEFRQCAGVAVTAGSACVIECCECMGGGPGGGGGGGAVGLRCADGCCVEDCTVINRNALAIECGSRCSVTCNHVVLCWGISCAAECCCCDNELSSCSGGPDTSERTGGAIVIHGSSSTCEGNFIANCRVGISVQLDGSYGHVCDNIVTGAGAGSDPAAGVSAGILIHDAAVGCLCTCNHLRAVPGTPPYLLGTASHGPIVVLAAGDISALPGSSHPLANTATVT